jgi:hypothetical protein
MPSPSSQKSEVRSQNVCLAACLFCSVASGGSFSYAVIGNEAGSWPAVLSSIGLVKGSAADAAVVIVTGDVKSNGERSSDTKPRDARPRAPQSNDSESSDTKSSGPEPNGVRSNGAKSRDTESNDITLNDTALNGATSSANSRDNNDANLRDNKVRGSPSRETTSRDTTARDTARSTPEWIARVEHGTILVIEGESSLAAAFGFRASAKPHAVARSVEDFHAPKLHIIWEKPLELPVFEIPAEARLFARERWQHIPLIAGFRKGSGAVLWVAAPLGDRGYERFPYIAQALADLGLETPFRSNRLWAFFDSAYRSRVDLDYFAARWRASGISALHVAAWHYWERDPQGDEYLRKLIEACHRHSIAVYAWLELPHVSEKFWDAHPEWREKTALLQDAQLDWRKLMNLSNRAAFAAVSKGARDLIAGFDWDGVNLAELYFESLEGYENPARLTPMNDDVRDEFRHAAGFDPVELFDARSERHWSKNTAGLGRFLDFRAELARRQQMEWIGEMEAIRKIKPHLDLTLTHVDDRFDTSMREKIGADASRLLPMLAPHDLTFLIEDPATVWNLGPQRYPQIAARYKGLTAAPEKLAIDINVVERYQDVYPTKQQTGTELFQLVNLASGAFERVALYFESSISTVDLPLLAAAASTVERAEQSGGKLVVDSRRGVTVKWSGPALVDGRLWPVGNGSSVLLPRGMHSIEAAPKAAAMRLVDFNGELKSASALADGVEFAYQSSARAMAEIDGPGALKRVEIDGAEVKPQVVGNVLLLPRGQHLVTIVR